MYKYHSIDKIFLDIHMFIIDYVKLFHEIHENSNDINVNMITIKLGKEGFCLSATFNNFSQRADELQHRLQSQIRIIAQKRRNNITKGIDTDNDNPLMDNQKKSYQFDDNFKIHLEQLQKNILDKNTDKMIRYIRAIMDAFELYNDIQMKKHFFNITFRLLPIIKYIQKQLCCISINIQKILDDNTSIIEQYLRKLQQKFNSYDKDMRNKLAKYISRDIRPPVLVIPCPINTYSPEIFTQMRSSNDNDLIQITSVNSEDSLSIAENLH